MSNLVAGSENVVEVDALRDEAAAAVVVTIGSGSSTTSVVTASIVPPPVSANEYAGRFLHFSEDTRTPSLRGRHTVISASTVDGVLSVSALPTAPVTGDTANIIAYLTDATVTVSLKDASGAAITGETWPKTLDYVAGSAGRYRAVLTDALGVSAGQLIQATISAVRGDLNRTWTEWWRVI